MDARTQSKLEYWDESYPDYCRTLYRDWTARARREEQRGRSASLALREIVRQEIARNRSLETYIRQCLGATRSPEQRLEDDVLSVSSLPSISAAPIA